MNPNLRVSQRDALLIEACINRAISLGVVPNPERVSGVVGGKISILDLKAGTSLWMDLIACHRNVQTLDLNKLLQAKDADFLRDLRGIAQYLSRDNADMIKLFQPRCAKASLRLQCPMTPVMESDAWLNGESCPDAVITIDAGTFSIWQELRATVSNACNKLLPYAADIAAGMADLILTEPVNAIFVTSSIEAESPAMDDPGVVVLPHDAVVDEYEFNDPSKFGESSTLAHDLRPTNWAVRMSCDALYFRFEDKNTEVIFESAGADWDVIAKAVEAA